MRAEFSSLRPPFVRGDAQEGGTTSWKDLLIRKMSIGFVFEDKYSPSLFICCDSVFCAPPSPPTQFRFVLLSLPRNLHIYTVPGSG